MSARGNGVSIWNSPGSIVEANEISFGRDGIFVITSRDNVFRDNRFRDLRFAVHYMYADKGTVSGNDSAGNHVGYALMYSAGLTRRGQPLRRRSRPRPAAELRQRRPDRGQCRGGGRREVRVHLQLHQERLSRQLVRGLPDRHPPDGGLGTQRDLGQRLHRQPDPGQVCRHALSGVVSLGSRQLLERQPGLRPERRRRGRPALPPERPDRPGGLELPAGQAAAEQPGGADGALRAGPVPGPAAGRRRRQRAAHGPALVPASMAAEPAG